MWCVNVVFRVLPQRVPRTKGNRRGSEGSLRGLSWAGHGGLGCWAVWKVWWVNWALLRKWQPPPSLHSIQLSTVQPRHRCSLRTDCRPGTRIQTGLESWRLAEGGGIKVGYRRHRLCSRFKWKWPTPFSQNRLFQIMTRTTATTAKTREWIVNDKCNETVFYVCQHCPQEAWTVVFNHVPLWFESLQVFVPAKHHSSRFHWLLHRQPVRGTNQTNCVP